MTRKQFMDYLDTLTSETGFDLSKEQKAFAYKAAKQYHKQSLLLQKNKNIKCGNENPPCSPNIKFGCLECMECDWSE